jgi:cytochrome bd-type quinol oxidase subunit 2
MARALLFFAGIFLVGQVIIAILATYRVLDLNAAGVILYMVALAPPVMDFVKRQQRLMTGGEKARYALGAMLISSVPSVVLIAVIDGGRVFRELGNEFSFQWQQGNMATVALFSGIAISVPLVLWGAAYFLAGASGKQALKAQERAQQNKAGQA